jgi:hypothetical protein
MAVNGRRPAGRVGGDDIPESRPKTDASHQGRVPVGRAKGFDQGWNFGQDFCDCRTILFWIVHTEDQE